MSEGYVTTNFKRHEFACKDGCGGKFYVSPELAKVLQRLRERVGTAIIITSGMRCKKHNAASNGAKKSKHLLSKGVLLASDITYADEKKRTPAGMMKLYILADKLLTDNLEDSRTGGLGLYPTWLHVDTRKETGVRWTDQRWKFPE